MSIPNFIQKFNSDLQDDLLNVIREVFYKFDKVATGRTLRSARIVTRVRSVRNPGVSMQVRMREGGLYIINGRSAGRSIPPPKEIEKWIRARGLTHLDPYATAISIGRRGFKGVGTEFFEEMDKRMKPIIDDYVRDNLPSAILNTITFTK